MRRFSIYAWLNTSAAGPDSLLGGFVRPRIPATEDLEQIYIPALDTLVPVPALWIRDQSGDGQRRLRIVRFGNAMKYEVYIDDVVVPLPGGPLEIQTGTLSKDGRMAAIEFTPRLNGEAFHRKVLVIDIERYLRERPPVADVQVIDFQERFCMYNFGGVWPEWLPNGNLAVTMHRDGDREAFIWEITPDGRTVRQLTFKP